MDRSLKNMLTDLQHNEIDAIDLCRQLGDTLHNTQWRIRWVNTI